MEGCGKDVFETDIKNGFPIQAMLNKESQGNYYGLLLID
ncbi:MAG: hypothetical protein GX949_06000 [Peptococcaceae bacterium]|jgi:hypothetical protein|nr:hypothetical protein [Peptococcaceae bacterium]